MIKNGVEVLVGDIWRRNNKDYEVVKVASGSQWVASLKQGKERSEWFMTDRDWKLISRRKVSGFQDLYLKLSQ
jgi:hypothetical protein